MALRIAPASHIPRIVGGVVLVLAVVAVVLGVHSMRHPATAPNSVAGSIEQIIPGGTPAPVVLSQTVGTAAWYDVPANSLAKKRAGVEELTAAHNKLPIGTLVRVTHLSNGKSVLVRITDRGIHDRRVKIDLCKEAAEELEMVSKGFAKVRMEVLQDTSATETPSHVATSTR
jgi:rare lipoprotein A